jgi:hypothetical protein
MDIELNPILKIGRINHVQWFKNAGCHYKNNLNMTNELWESDDDELLNKIFSLLK